MVEIAKSWKSYTCFSADYLDDDVFTKWCTKTTPSASMSEKGASILCLMLTSFFISPSALFCFFFRRQTEQCNNVVIKDHTTA